MEVRPRTRAGYTHLIGTYVAPRIGRIRLQALRPADLSTLYRELMESGGRGLAGSSWVGGDHVFRRELGEPLFPDTPTA